MARPSRRGRARPGAGSGVSWRRAREVADADRQDEDSHDPADQETGKPGLDPCAGIRASKAADAERDPGQHAGDAVRNRHQAGYRVAIERAADRYTLICDRPDNGVESGIWRGDLARVKTHVDVDLLVCEAVGTIPFGRSPGRWGYSCFRPGASLGCRWRHSNAHRSQMTLPSVSSRNLRRTPSLIARLPFSFS